MPVDIAALLAQPSTQLLAPGPAEVRTDPRARAFHELTGQHQNTPPGEFLGNTLGNFAMQAAPEAAFAAAGPIGRAGKLAAPTLARALLGGGVMGGTAVAAGEEGESDPRDALIGAQMAAQREADAALAAMQQEEKSGRGPRYDAAAQAYQAAQAKLDQINGSLKIAEEKYSPEAQRQQRLQAELDAEEKKRRELDMPFAERHPGIAQALPVAGLAGALGLGRYGAGKIARKGTQLLDDVANARSAGDTIGLAEALAKTNRWQKAAPFQGAGYVAGGGLAGAEARSLPDQIDAIGLPEGSAARDAAREKFKDPETYLQSMLPLIAGGMATAFTGKKMGPQAPRSDARGVLDVYGKGVSAPSLAKELSKGSRSSRKLQGELSNLELAQTARASRNQAARQLDEQLQGAGAVSQLSRPTRTLEHHSLKQPRNKTTGRFE